MGKKTNNTTKPAAVTKPAVKAAAKPPTVRKTVAAPAKSAKPPAPKLRRASKAKAARNGAITTDDIALRAYFIAEKRRLNGLSGDEHNDWLEAERQLLAESARK